MNGITQVDQQSTQRISLGAKVLGGLSVAAVMVAGIFILGRLANSDLVAMAMTTVFFAALFAFLAVVVYRRREWLLPLAIPFGVVALGAGAILGPPLFTDKVVDEQVVVAEVTPDDVAPVDPSAAAPAPEPVNVKVSSGSFEALSHPGIGTATLIQTPQGAKVTLTNFETDNGPDVRVYLSRGTDPAGKGESFVDLGAMKGNKGNQQYDIPADLKLSEFDAVVLWCRAFDVGFTQAPLAAA